MALVKREQVGVLYKDIADGMYNGGVSLDNGDPVLNPVDPLPPDPPQDPVETNDTPITPKPTPDNSLLILGAVAVYGIIAFGPSGRRVSGTGPSTPSGKWLLPGLGLAAVLGYMILKKGGGSTASKTDYLVNWAYDNAPSMIEAQSLAGVFGAMEPAEIDAVYSYVKDYFSQGKKPAAGSPLAAQIAAISTKYNIFT